MSREVSGAEQQKARSFKDLTVWQKSMDLAVGVYQLTANFPRDEQFRITAQLTRAVASVPANIAEGHARGTRRDYAYFVSVAQGSLAETETFLVLVQRPGYTGGEHFEAMMELLREVSRMLAALHARLRSPPAAPGRANDAHARHG